MGKDRPKGTIFSDVIPKFTRFWGKSGALSLDPANLEFFQGSYTCYLIVDAFCCQAREKMAKKGRGDGDRFRLQIYERMWQRWAWPCILIIVASIVLWWFAPRISIIYRPWNILTLAPAFISLALLVYAFMARRLSWVQCRANHLRIQTPFYPLIISYSRIKAVRPNPFHKVFDPRSEKEARRRWLLPYWPKTVIVVELSKYPMSRAWLRLWFSPYLLCPDIDGFVFLVEDWMAFSRQADDFRTNWEQRRAERRQQTSVY
ncbi:MAG TPA: hypothetical protein G4N99_09885 [Thermoflexia bacterium]|nr:hypothetical protein [Thermoflexia bacterium]